MHLRYSFQLKVLFLRLVFSNLHLIYQILIAFYVAGLLLDTKGADVNVMVHMPPKLQLNKGLSYSRRSRMRQFPGSNFFVLTKVIQRKRRLG